MPGAISGERGMLLVAPFDDDHIEIADVSIAGLHMAVIQSVL
jgi:hypothetical protein